MHCTDWYMEVEPDVGQGDKETRDKQRQGDLRGFSSRICEWYHASRRWAGPGEGAARAADETSFT